MASEDNKADPPDRNNLRGLPVSVLLVRKTVPPAGDPQRYVQKIFCDNLISGSLQMFFTLLFVLLGVSAITTIPVVVFFKKYIKAILKRLIGEPLYKSWEKFIIFALFVVGIASTVNPHRLEKYVLKSHTDQIISELSPDAWFLEIYQTFLAVLSSLAFSLMSFFTVALIAYIIVRGLELKKA